MSSRTERLRAALRWPCKTCGAGRGEPCRTRAGHPAAEPHVNRQNAYMRNAGILLPAPKGPGA